MSGPAESPVKFYVWGEDLAAGLVGPFNSHAEAEEHLRFQEKRGDAAVTYHHNACVISETLAKQTWAWKNNLCSPEEDKTMNMGPTFNRRS